MVDKKYTSLSNCYHPICNIMILFLVFIDEISQILRNQGLVSECIISRTARNERLSVFKFYHSTSN